MHIVFSVQSTGTPLIGTIGFTDASPGQTGSSIALSVTGGRPSLVNSGPYNTGLNAPLNISWQGT
jgi:hypothetical protein